jgi:hypothetical protein
MLTAKDIIIKPILAKDANNLVKRVHYSGKVVPNSQLHFGVFLQNKLEGAMSFGPPINKKGTINIVKDTSWSGMLELNRMAFSDKLPRNSESRAMSIAFKIIKQNYPQIEWIVSFSDGTQCGDGSIYRAAGFILTDIRQSDALRINPKTNEIMHVIQAHHLMLTKEFKTWKPTIGYQMRYVYFINKDAQKRLNVPIIPFTKIIDIGASMYKGQKIMRIKKQELEDHSNLGGAIPTDTLQLSEL